MVLFEKIALCLWIKKPKSWIPKKILLICKFHAIAFLKKIKICKIHTGDKSCWHFNHPFCFNSALTFATLSTKSWRFLRVLREKKKFKIWIGYPLCSCLWRELLRVVFLYQSPFLPQGLKHCLQFLGLSQYIWRFTI